MLITPVLWGQQLSTKEHQLYELLMKYREEYGLSKIPLSPNLTFVAQTHVRDLRDNYVRGSLCNMHSWSAKGEWTPVCYTGDHANAKGMWLKPSELTSYKGFGYEIAFSGSDNPEIAIEGWKKSSGHNAVMINAGLWQQKWNAVGIGMLGEYAVIWFGHETDNAK